MANRPLPGIDFIRNRIAYAPDSGALVWRERPEGDFRGSGKINAATRAKMWNNRHAGTRACNTPAATGHLVGHIAGRLMLAHRVAFAIMEGRWPSLVDHINGNPTDNRWSNLRETDKTGNAKNCCVTKRNQVGRTGVRLSRRGNGFTAHIRSEGRDYYLGHFTSIAEASAARRGAEKVLGFSARHGQELPDR